MDYNQQNFVIGQGLYMIEPKDGRLGSVKTMTTKFFLLDEGKRAPVCKKTFMDVFRITSDRILTVTKKMRSGKLSLKDKRGKAQKVKIPENSRDQVRQHIAAFPTVESHYGRRNGENSMKYLEPGLNLEKMYGLYIELCRQNGLPEVESWVYRDVFAKDFKLTFSQPKQDTCDHCDKLLAKINTETVQARKDEIAYLRDSHVEQSNNIIYTT